jgi:hypothetical protein
MPPTFSKKGLTPEESKKAFDKLGLTDITREESHRIAEEVNMKPTKKAFDRSLSLQQEPFERDLYYHANVSKSKLSKLSAKEQEEYNKKIEDMFDNKDNLVKYVRAVLPENVEKGVIINNIYLEKKGFRTKDEIDKYIMDNKLIKNKSTLKSKIIKFINEIESSSNKIPKNKVNNNLVSMIFDLVEDVTKAPKTKSIETESVKDQIKEIEKLLKTPKKTLKKLIEADKLHLKYHPSEQDYKEMKMDQKIYKKKVTNVEPHIANYVATYKELMNKDNKGGARTRAINKHISNFMQVARPSDISTANALIREIKEGQTKVVAPTKAKKITAPKDSKYKSVTTYVKKNVPSLTNDEDIHIVVTELISKDKRMSKKLLDQVLKDFEID